MTDNIDKDTAPAPKAKAKDNAQPERRSASEKVEAARETAVAEREALMKPADIGAATPKEIDASGSIMEPSVKDGIDVDHPAVDNNPRAGTTARQNQVDFNDPNLRDDEAVEENLSNQS